MQRPTSVTVFGILNIVFAALGILGLLGTIALFAVSGTANNPVVKIIQEQPIYGSYLKLSIVLGVLASAALLAAGIGLLLLKNWARMLSIIYAIYAIVFGVIGVIMNFLFLMRPMLAEASQKQGAETAGAIGGVIGGSIGGCLGLVYPILLLIFMTRPKVAAAFQSQNVEPPFTG